MLLIYAWEDKNDTGITKIGQTFCKSGDPAKAVAKRIRASLGQRKDLWDDGRISFSYWDASEYAKAVGKYSAKAKFDSHIRPKIGKHKSYETHHLTLTEAKDRVSKVLEKGPHSTLREKYILVKTWARNIFIVCGLLSGLLAIIAANH
mgnify:CR=1 FL=1